MNKKINLIINKISALLEENELEYQGDLWETHKTEDYGLSEFVSGKIEAYKECLRIISKNTNN